MAAEQTNRPDLGQVQFLTVAEVAAIMREVDVRRHSFVRELYKDVGLNDEQADSFAFLHMSYTIGGRILMADGDATTYEKGWKVAVPPGVRS